MKQLKALLAVYLLFVCAVSVCPAQSPPASVILGEIRVNGGYIAGVVDDPELGSDTYDADMAAAVLEKASACIDALEQAAAAKIPDSTTVELEIWDETKTVTLAEVRAMCERASSLAGRRTLVADVERTAANTVVWSAEFRGKRPERDDALAAKIVSRDLVAAVDAALEAGIPGAKRVEVGSTGERTIAEARELGVYVNTESQRVLDEYAAEEAAKMAPFLKVLSGDKARVFKEEWGLVVFGRGGRRLDTPAEFAAADAWFISGGSTDAYPPYWRVHAMYFRGSALVRRQTRRGYGNSSPGWAFQ